ncbi:MAG: guanylate kinase [Deltaproteobacteria bacterium]
MTKKNKAIVFTAPSGAGKTTIVKHLLNTFPQKLSFSISATTRQKREIETHGKDYYFISTEDFRDKIASGDFIEWEEVYENQFYGTLKSEIERIWSDDKTVVFDVDVKGATKIKQYFGSDCLAVFVSPPDLETLIDRLKKRGTENPQSLKKRIDRIKSEMKYRDKFDTVVVNDLLDHTFSKAEKLVIQFLGWDDTDILI